MKYEELQHRMEWFNQYMAKILPWLGRRDRGHHARIYVCDLLVEGGRKTPATIAKRWPGGNVQALQQLLGQSPWDYERVRRAVCNLILKELPPDKPVWIIDDTAFPKKGSHSVGVAHQYCGTLGKVANCQVAVSLNYATRNACFPVDFSLYLPESWTENPARRRKVGIPPDVEFRPKWQLAIQLIDRGLDWELPCGPVLADAVYGRIPEFRKALQQRELHYVVGVDSTTRVTLPATTSAPSQGPDGFEIYPGDAERDTALAVALRSVAWEEVTWREGTKGALKSRFWAGRVLAEEGEVWLLAEWPVNSRQPEKFWLSDLPADTPLAELVYYAKSRWWVEQNYQQLKTELGLDHYEGRTWLGWHHHVTLVMVAFGFLVLELIRAKKNGIGDHPEPAADSAGVHNPAGKILSHVSSHSPK